MLIIPSIDLKNGKVIEKIKYSDEFEHYYEELSDHPKDLCQLWRSENAKTLHINDLDGNPDSPNISIILDILECLDIPITLSSTSSSVEVCELFLDKGLFRVALCQFLIENPEIVRNLIEKYTSSRIIFYAIVKDDELLLWGKKTGIKFEDYLDMMTSVGASRLIYGNPDWDKSNSKPDYSILSHINSKTNFKISVYGGVTHYSHFIELEKYKHSGIDSVILSKPLYENNFPCQEIWRIAETS